MFKFKQAAVILFLAIFTALAAEDKDHKYPITPDEVAGIKNLGKGINTPDSEYTPFITPDEKYLFFQSNREPSAGGDGDFDLWYSKNNAQNRGVDEPVFDTAANVGLPVNSPLLDGHPTLRKLPSGEHEMYFSSFAAPGGRPGPALTNIYYTAWRGGKWLEPVPVAELNTEFHDRMPSISEDGKFLFFSSDRPGGKGGDDIWVSHWDEATGKWGVPQNAGPVNTAESEVTPAIHSDGTTLYFSSNHAGGVGGYDIYFTQSVSRLDNPEAADMLSGGWTPPLNLGKPFNSQFDDEYPTVIASGQRVYFTSNRPEGNGGFDIFRAMVPQFARPIMRITLKGKTYSGRSNRIIVAKVELTSGGFKTFAETAPDRQDPYSLNLASKKEYEITVQAEGYRIAKDKFDTRNIHESTTIEKDFRLVRDLRLPQKIALAVTALDEKGEATSAKVQYRFKTGDKKLRKLALKNGTGRIALMDKSDFKTEEEAILALEGYVAEVIAEKAGYETLKEKYAVSTLLDGVRNEAPETLELKLQLKAKPKVAVPKEEEEEEEEEEKVEEKPRPAGTVVLKFMGRVYFAHDSHDKLAGNEDAFLASIAAKWKKNPRKRIIILGHTDSRGERGYNRSLSKKRAEYVKSLLVAKGVKANKIVTRGLGEKQLRHRNDNTDAKRQKNRRADIYMPVPGPAAEAKPADKPAEPASDAKPAEPAAENKPAPATEPAPADAPAEKPANE